MDLGEGKKLVFRVLDQRGVRSRIGIEAPTGYRILREELVPKPTDTPAPEVKEG